MSATTDAYNQAKQSNPNLSLADFVKSQNTAPPVSQTPASAPSSTVSSPTSAPTAATPFSRDFTREQSTLTSLSANPSQLQMLDPKQLYEATYTQEELAGMPEYQQIMQRDQAQANLLETPRPTNSMMRVLEDALRAKSDVGNQALGGSELYGKAGLPTEGVSGYATLMQSMNERGREMQDRYGSFSNSLARTSEAMSDTFNTALDQYNILNQDYQQELQRFQQVADNLTAHEQAMTLMERQYELQKEAEQFSWDLENKTSVTNPAGIAGTSDSSEMYDLGTGDNSDNCVIYGRTKVTNLPFGLFTKEDKMKAVQMAGVKNDGQGSMSGVKVGDAILTGEGQYGHVAVVMGIEGDNLILDEANYVSGQITQGRKINMNDAKIMGYVPNERGDAITVSTDVSNLKPRYDTSLPTGALQASGKQGEGVTEGIDEQVGKLGGGIGTPRELTASDKTEANKLAVQEYGATVLKTSEGREFFLQPILDRMANGESIDDIADDIRYKGQSEGFTGTLRDAAQQITSDYTDKKTQIVMDKMDDLIGREDTGALLDYLKKIAVETVGTDEQKQIKGKERTLEFLGEIGDDLIKYEENGGDTNIFSGTTEDILRKAGLVKSPELRTIANKIAIAIQQYRRSMSGAAFSVPESAEYEAIFPSIDNVATLNSALLQGLDETFTGDIDYFYSFAMGEDAYNDIFKNGATGEKGDKGSDIYDQEDLDFYNSL